MIRSAQWLAELRSDRSSASSEARNSAASMARRSLLHGRRLLVLPPGPAGPPGLTDGGSARIRARMNAWYDANDSLTGGLSAASVSASAASSMRPSDRKSVV